MSLSAARVGPETMKNPTRLTAMNTPPSRPAAQTEPNVMIRRRKRDES